MVRLCILDFFYHFTFFRRMSSFGFIANFWTNFQITTKWTIYWWWNIIVKIWNFNEKYFFVKVCNLCRKKWCLKQHGVVKSCQKKNQIKAISKPRFRIPDPTRKTIACNFYLLEIRIIVVGIVTLLLFISCFNCIYYI